MTMSIALNRRPLRPTELRLDAVYYSPRGLMCILVPQRKVGIGSAGELFEFRYIGVARDEGFWLRKENLHIMRVAA